jgi:hypothetical protein
LGAVAPTLATALGGPLGGMAMKMVADKLGLPDASPEALDAAVASATPEQLAEIKKVEADFKVQMKRWMSILSKLRQRIVIARGSVTPP